MKALKLLVSISVLAALAACSNVDSSQVVPTEIHTSYATEYSDDDGMLRVTAHFAVGGSLGTNVVLDEGSYVTFDGERLRRDIGIVGTVAYGYERFRPGHDELSAFHELEYVDNRGRIYRNSVRLPSAIQVQVMPVAPGADIAVRWTSDESLDPQESISASLTPRSGVDPVFASDNLGGRDGWVYFRRGDWEKHAGREVLLNLCRRRSTSGINAPSAGGFLSTHYCARKIPVYLPQYR